MNGHYEELKILEKAQTYRARQIAYMAYMSIPLKKGVSHKPIDVFWPMDGEVRIEETKEQREQLYNSVKWLN